MSVLVCTINVPTCSGSLQYFKSRHSGELHAFCAVHSLFCNPDDWDPIEPPLYETNTPGIYTTKPIKTIQEGTGPMATFRCAAETSNCYGPVCEYKHRVSGRTYLWCQLHRPAGDYALAWEIRDKVAPETGAFVPGAALHCVGCGDVHSEPKDRDSQRDMMRAGFVFLTSGDGRVLCPDCSRGPIDDDPDPLPESFPDPLQMDLPADQLVREIAPQTPPERIGVPERFNEQIQLPSPAMYVGMLGTIRYEYRAYLARFGNPTSRTGIVPILMGQITSFDAPITVEDMTANGWELIQLAIRPGMTLDPYAALFRRVVRES